METPIYITIQIYFYIFLKGFVLQKTKKLCYETVLMEKVFVFYTLGIWKQGK